MWAVSRYAGAIYGVTQGLVFERDYFEMTIREVSTGRRQDPPAGLKTFREAFFHLPAELAAEVTSAGFACEPCLGVVGPAWLVPDLRGAWADVTRRNTLTSLARALERECILSPQLFCGGRK